MKKVLMVAVMMLFASTAMASNFGYFKVDPIVSMQKMAINEWYDGKALFFGSKPNVGLMWNKKNINQGILQIGFDTNNGSNMLVLSPKSLFGMPLNSVDLSDDMIGIHLLHSLSDSASFSIDSNSARLHSDKRITVESEDELRLKGAGIAMTSTGQITLTPNSANVIRLAGETLIDEVNIFTLTQEDVGATCTTGQIKLDTGGATKELCYCESTNSWLCADLAAGPKD